MIQTTPFSWIFTIQNKWNHTKSLHMPKWTTENHLGCGRVSPGVWLFPITDALPGKAQGLATIVYSFTHRAQHLLEIELYTTQLQVIFI